MNVKETLERIAADVLVKHQGIFLVEMTQRQDHYELVLDGDQPIGIYDISALSREINAQADELMPEARYSLDITSPGADSPLKLLRQYPKHAGREFELQMTDGSVLKGRLRSVEGETLGFELSGQGKQKKNAAPEMAAIDFHQIKQGKIIISFK